jgi:hypothetical protein
MGFDYHPFAGKVSMKRRIKENYHGGKIEM